MAAAKPEEYRDFTIDAQSSQEDALTLISKVMNRCDDHLKSLSQRMGALIEQVDVSDYGRLPVEWWFVMAEVAAVQVVRHELSLMNNIAKANVKAESIWRDRLWNITNIGHKDFLEVLNHLFFFMYKDSRDSTFLPDGLLAREASILMQYGLDESNPRDIKPENIFRAGSEAWEVESLLKGCLVAETEFYQDLQLIIPKPDLDYEHGKLWRREIYVDVPESQMELVLRCVELARDGLFVLRRVDELGVHRLGLLPELLKCEAAVRDLDCQEGLAEKALDGFTSIADIRKNFGKLGDKYKKLLDKVSEYDRSAGSDCELKAVFACFRDLARKLLEKIRKVKPNRVIFHEETLQLLDQAMDEQLSTATDTRVLADRMIAYFGGLEGAIDFGGYWMDLSKEQRELMEPLADLCVKLNDEFFVAFKELAPICIAAMDRLQWARKTVLVIRQDLARWEVVEQKLNSIVATAQELISTRKAAVESENISRSMRAATAVLRATPGAAVGSTVEMRDFSKR